MARNFFNHIIIILQQPGQTLQFLEISLLCTYPYIQFTILMTDKLFNRLNKFMDIEICKIKLRILKILQSVPNRQSQRVTVVPGSFYI